MKDKICKTKGCKNMINSKLSKSGLCTKCCNKSYRENHKKERRAYTKKYMKKYRKENKKEIKKSAGKYYLNNKESFRKNGERYYKNNTEKQKAYSKNNYENNKEEKAKYSLEYHNRRYREDEGFRIRKQLGNALRRVLNTYIKNGRIINPMPQYAINWAGIMKVLTPIPQPRSDYDIDHIIPLYRFDLTNIEQVQLAFSPENHRWLLKKDNQKRDKPNTKWRKKSK